MMYKNQHMKISKRFKDVLFEEIRVLRFEEVGGTGKIKLIPKEEQKQ